MAEFDLIVVGGGSGGVRAARMAASHGARVALVEASRLGGTCVNVGCVPKKLYSYAAHYSADFADSAGFGWQLEGIRFDWATLRDRKSAEIARLNGVYQSLLEKAGVHLVRGFGRLLGGGRVAVGAEVLQGQHILLATGGRPQAPDFAGAEYTVTSDQIFDLPTLPRRLLILGAGYIGVEFAGIFAGLGVQTSLSWRGDLPLRGFDQDLRQRFCREASKHCQLLPGSRCERIERQADGSLQVLFNGGRVLETDLVFAALGRRPLLEGLGLENTAVSLGPQGTVMVDEHFCTTDPGIHAVGDVVGHLPLTPVALAEAMVVVDRLFGQRQRRLDYRFIPTAVFSQPNLATVGLTEDAARLTCADVAVFETDFRHLRHTLSGRDERTYMKVLVDSASDRVLGMHMMGAEAGEILQGFATALVCGLTKTQLDATIGIHPTAAEEFVTLRTRSR
jgi:glutathione reductase (NADPH)